METLPGDSTSGSSGQDGGPAIAKKGGQGGRGGATPVISKEAGTDGPSGAGTSNGSGNSGNAGQDPGPPIYSPAGCDPLPAATGNRVEVQPSQAGDLRAIVAGLSQGDTVLLADGTQRQLPAFFGPLKPDLKNIAKRTC